MKKKKVKVSSLQKMKKKKRKRYCVLIELLVGWNFCSNFIGLVLVLRALEYYFLIFVQTIFGLLVLVLRALEYYFLIFVQTVFGLVLVLRALQYYFLFFFLIFGLVRKLQGKLRNMQAIHKLPFWPECHSSGTSWSHWWVPFQIFWYKRCTPYKWLGDLQFPFSMVPWRAIHFSIYQSVAFFLTAPCRIWRQIGLHLENPEGKWVRTRMPMEF